MRALVEPGYVVVANGGGGIPVVREADGALRGVEAVIDKDLGAALLAAQSTPTCSSSPPTSTHAVLDFGTPDAQPIGEVDRRASCARTPARATSPSGSMGPKVDAVCRFVERGGRAPSSPPRPASSRASAATTGTVVVPDRRRPLTAEPTTEPTSHGGAHARAIEVRKVPIQHVVRRQRAR